MFFEIIWKKVFFFFNVYFYKVSEHKAGRYARKKLAFIPRGEYEERVDWFKWPFNS